ncbi:MAG: redoxin family protein, partial [Sphingobium sp.]
MLGRPVPDVILKTRVRDESVGGPNPFRWQDVGTGELFKGKRTAVFSLPGAFTPTCSNEQCPAFERLYDDFKAAGIDEVYCISVNDAFVMSAWNKSDGSQDITMLADGNGAFSEAVGLSMDASKFGMGQRSQRYSMLVNDG